MNNLDAGLSIKGSVHDAYACSMIYPCFIFYFPVIFTKENTMLYFRNMLQENFSVGIFYNNTFMLNAKT